MKYGLFFLLLLTFSPYAFAQTNVVIRGIIKDKITGEPLIGAHIQCKNGVSSDVHGFFSIDIPESGQENIKVSYVGYKDYFGVIDAKNDKLHIIELEPGVNLDEINVTAIKGIEDRMEIGVIEIPVHQIKTLPLIGETDVLKALQLMPGVQAGSDGRNGFYVRGGSPDQNLFMLDGTPIYYVNHLGGFVSVFHTEILKNVKLYKGGFPSRYGGRLSSIVDLRIKEGNRKEHHGSWGIGLVSGDFNMEGPINEKTSYIVSFRRMWIDFLLRPATKIAYQNGSMGYNFYDFFGKITHQPNATNRIYFSLYGGDDHLGFNYKMKEKDSKGYSKYTWGNVLASCRWNHIYSPRFYNDMTLFYSRYRYRLSQLGEYDENSNRMTYSTGLHELGLKSDFNWQVKNAVSLSFGFGLSHSWFRPGQMVFSDEERDKRTEEILGEQNQVKAINTFVYSENEIKLSSSLSLNVGARFSILLVDTENYLSLEPRFLLKYRLKNKGAFSAGYSRMIQPMHMLSYSGSSFPVDIWLPSNNNIAPAKSDLFSLAYVQSIEKGKFEISAELYRKKMSQLVEIKGGIPLVNSNKWDENVEKNGKGYSTGIELMVQKKQGKSTGWISYTLAKSDRHFNNINNGKTYPFKYDRRHDLTVVFNHKISDRVDFSATWTYGSGYPITFQSGMYQSIVPSLFLPNMSDDYFTINNESYIYPAKNWLRMRDYHRLDIGFNFHKKKGDRERIWTVGIYNVYNRQNAVFYYYAKRNGHNTNSLVLYQQSGFPIIPTVKYSVKF